MGSQGMFVGDWMSPSMLNLLSKSDTIFTGLKTIDQTTNGFEQTGVEAEQRYHRVLTLYQNELDEYRNTLPADEAEVPFRMSEVMAWVHMLYLPADGMGTGVVGEEILRWLNIYHARPTSEQSNDVADLADPVNDAMFWEYLYTCVLRGLQHLAAAALGKLDTHPSASLRRFTSQLSQLILTMPRSTNFMTEADFAAERRLWNAELGKLFTTLESSLDQMEQESDVDSEQRFYIEAVLSCLLQILHGKEDRILESTSGWRDALGAWGLYVDPLLKRGDIRPVLTTILDRFPHDPTSAVESAITAFGQAEPLLGLQATRDIDPWLAVHLTDLLGRAGVLDQDAVAARQLLFQTIDTYATVVMDDQGLWRIAVAYLSASGDEARKRMRELLLSVPYDISSASSQDVSEGSRFQRVEELQRACLEFGMIEESRAICQGVANTLVDQHEYGQAAAYSARAGNATLIRIIIEKVLDVYGASGSSAFTQALDQFPSLWLYPHTGNEITAKYTQRLAFLGAYRDFHQSLAEEDYAAAARTLLVAFAARAPESFWAVLLIDAIPFMEAGTPLFSAEDLASLMSFFNQVVSEADATPLGAKLYLTRLACLGQPQTETPTEVQLSHARQRLELVRFALARAVSRSVLDDNASLNLL